MILLVGVTLGFLALFGIAVVEPYFSTSADPDTENASLNPPQSVFDKVASSLVDILVSTIYDHLQGVSEPIKTRLSDFLLSLQPFTAALRRPQRIFSVSQDRFAGEAIVWITETSTDPIVLIDAIQVAPEVIWYPDLHAPTSVLDFLLPKVAEGVQRRQQGISESESDKMDAIYSAFLLFFWNNITLDYNSMKTWAQSPESQDSLSAIETCYAASLFFS